LIVRYPNRVFRGHSYRDSEERTKETKLLLDLHSEIERTVKFLGAKEKEKGELWKRRRD